jgi:hypothetical protein
MAAAAAAAAAAEAAAAQQLTAAAKRGGELLLSGDTAGAASACDDGFAAAQRARDACGELSPDEEAALLGCCATAAACALRRDDAAAAAAAARDGLRLASAPAQPALHEQLLLRLAQACAALGDAPAAGAALTEADTRGMPLLRAERVSLYAQLSLPPPPPLAPPEAAYALVSGAASTQCHEDAEEVVGVLAHVRGKVHVDVRDKHGMNAMWGACATLRHGGEDDEEEEEEEEVGVAEQAGGAGREEEDDGERSHAWLVAQLLAVGASPNQRYDDSGQTPLMLAAHAGTPEARDCARALLAAGGHVNARDGSGWTPLLCAVATDRGGAPCAAMLALLLAAGASASVPRTEHGHNALHLLALSLRRAHAGDALAAVTALLDAAGEHASALLLDGGAPGATPLCLALRTTRWGAHPVCAALREAMAARGHAEEAEEDWRVAELLRLMDALRDAADAAAATGLGGQALGVERDARCLSALLAAAGLPADAGAACHEHPNPLAHAHAWLRARIPRACAALHDAAPPYESHAAGVLRHTGGGGGAEEEEEEDGLDVASSGLQPFPPDLQARRADASLPAPRLWWTGSEALHELAWAPLARGFAHAVPCDEALDALRALSPLLEVGAGAGYWAALLRARGTDVLATDAAPPDGAAALSQVACAEGAHAAAQHGAARTLLLVWPLPPGDVGAPWDAAALAAFPGRVVAHVGEARGATPLRGHLAHGATTSAAFQDALARDFECVRRVPLPTRPGLEDELTIWERRPTAGVAAGGGA